MKCETIVGIDEAGRGAWAGPLFAAAVVLRQPLPGLADSKKLTRLQRYKLRELIKAKAISYGIGMVSAGYVDRMGLTVATRLAMRRALRGAKNINTIIIDGSFNYLIDDKRSRTLIDADALIPSVMAASIIAKVERDEWMGQLALRYPQYGFERHVGYGTRFHQACLRLYGTTPEHRQSFKPISRL